MRYDLKSFRDAADARMPEMRIYPDIIISGVYESERHHRRNSRAVICALAATAAVLIGIAIITGSATLSGSDAPLQLAQGLSPLKGDASMLWDTADTQTAYLYDATGEGLSPDFTRIIESWNPEGAAPAQTAAESFFNGQRADMHYIERDHEGHPYVEKSQNIYEQGHYIIVSDAENYLTPDEVREQYPEIETGDENFYASNTGWPRADSAIWLPDPPEGWEWMYFYNDLGSGIITSYDVSENAKGGSDAVMCSDGTISDQYFIAIYPYNTNGRALAFAAAGDAELEAYGCQQVGVIDRYGNWIGETVCAHVDRIMRTVDNDGYADVAYYIIRPYAAQMENDSNGDPVLGMYYGSTYIVDTDFRIVFRSKSLWSAFGFDDTSRMPYQDGETGLWGYLDEDMHLCGEAIYLDARDFSEGLAAVQDAESGLYGFIDENFNYVIAPQYQYVAWWFTDGSIRVFPTYTGDNPYWHRIDRQGNDITSWSDYAIQWFEHIGHSIRG